MSRSESRSTTDTLPLAKCDLPKQTSASDAANATRLERPPASRAQDAVLALGRRAIARPAPEILINDAARLIAEIAGTELALVVDSSGWVQTMNRACTKITGFARDDFMNRPAWAVLAPPNEIQTYQEAIARLTNTGPPFAFEATLLTKHSEHRTVAWRFVPAQASGGESPSFILTGIDITDQRRAEKRAERAKKALAHLRSTSGGVADGDDPSESGRTGVRTPFDRK